MAYKVIGSSVTFMDVRKPLFMMENLRNNMKPHTKIRQGKMICLIINSMYDYLSMGSFCEISLMQYLKEMVIEYSAQVL